MIASSLKEEQQDGSDEIVDLLLNKGADINIKSEFSWFFWFGPFPPGVEMEGRRKGRLYLVRLRGTDEELNVI